VYIDKAKAKN